MIREFGFTQPLLIDEDDMILAGHGRVMAANILKLPELPVIVLRGLSEAQKRAIVIADNRAAELGGWDNELLTLELGELKHLDYNLELTGFDESDYVGFVANANRGATDPEATPPVPAIAITKPGDVWLMGKHRLVCGDCTKKEDVEKALDGKHPLLMVTDPPYGVDYNADFRNGIRRADGSIVSARAIGKVENDDRADWQAAYDLFPGDVAYVWCPSLRIHEFAASLVAAGFDLRASIIWVKNQMAIGRGDYHWQHEPCWYVVRKGKTGHWQGDRTQTTTWFIDKPSKSETGHSTQKPVECMQRPLENNSAPGDYAYEAFCGSGTTIIAGEICGRFILAIEIKPEYVDVSVERWQAYTKLNAILEGDGRTFADVAKARREAPPKKPRRAAAAR